MSFNSIQFPQSVIQRVAVDAAFDAEAALEAGRRAVSRRGITPAEVAAEHRKVKAKQSVARNLSAALRRSH